MIMEYIYGYLFYFLQLMRFRYNRYNIQPVENFQDDM